MKILPPVFAALLLFACGAKAQNSDDLSDAEVQGQKLAQEILVEKPAQDSTNTGVLQIRNKNGESANLYLTVTTTIEPNNYQIDYNVKTNSIAPSAEWLKIIESPNNPTIYYTSQHQKGWIESDIFDASLLRGNQTMTPFAGSDFWICDLGLEFFHWPDQKIIKHETRRTRACAVLESINPHPTPGGYSRVETWIDNETLGIVHAEAFDANGKLLKIFDPKSFKKVNGQWELQDMEIRNVQTHSRTWIKFDLNSGS